MATDLEPTAGRPVDRLHRFTLTDYRRMGELGLIRRSDRAVLLDGLLVRTMTKGPRHVLAVLAGAKLLAMALPDGWHARPGSPIELPAGPDGDSAPEPDLAVVAGSMTDDRDRHPTATDVALVVEVADSTLGEGRRGPRRYAWAGIPVAWLVNLRVGVVEVHSDPTGPTADPGYATRTVRTIGEALDLMVGGRVVPGLLVTDFFG